MSDGASAAFSLELSDDLTETRDWLHGFAESVIRPAAAEWDEREETPWPVLEEAAKVGLYSLDFYGQQYLEGSGLGIPVAFEEVFWGDAGIGLSLAGSSLAVAAGHARAVRGAEVPHAGEQGLAPRRGRAVRRPDPGPVRGRRPGPARRAPGAGPRGRSQRRAGRHEDLRGVAARGGGDGGRRGA